MVDTKEAPPPPPPPPAALLPALGRFERGDIVGATTETRALLADPDPEVQEAARDLLARMGPDPWALRFGLLALGLLVLLVLVYVR
jgi:hypothetical protein